MMVQSLGASRSQPETPKATSKNKGTLLYSFSYRYLSDRWKQGRGMGTNVVTEPEVSFWILTAEPVEPIL